MHWADEDQYVVPRSHERDCWGGGEWFLFPGAASWKGPKWCRKVKRWLKVKSDPKWADFLQPSCLRLFLWKGITSFDSSTHTRETPLKVMVSGSVFILYLAITSTLPSFHLLYAGLLGPHQGEDDVLKVSCIDVDFTDFDALFPSDLTMMVKTFLS